MFKVKSVIVFLFVLFFSTFVFAQDARTTDVDFIYYIQMEIGMCVKNMDTISGSSDKRDLFMKECADIVTDSNKLGKIQFGYKLNNSNDFKTKVETCSQYLKTKEFIQCIYKDNQQNTKQ